MIKQAHVSKVLRNFVFKPLYGLGDYKHKNAPLVVFGCYTAYDMQVVKEHKSYVVIVWTGMDSKTQKDIHLVKEMSHVTNVTALDNVHKHLNSIGIKCFKIKQTAPYGHDKISLTTLGDKVYMYLPAAKPEYHGSKLIEHFDFKEKLLLPDNTMTSEEWRNGGCDKYYNQCHMGLCLSEYAGGGYSIIEMGLRGMPVVTNVLNLPHTLSWDTVEDINGYVSDFNFFNNINSKILAENVYESLYHPKGDGFKTDEMLCEI